MAGVALSDRHNVGGGLAALANAAREQSRRVQKKEARSESKVTEKCVQMLYTALVSNW